MPLLPLLLPLQLQLLLLLPPPPLLLLLLLGVPLAAEVSLDLASHVRIARQVGL